MSRNADFALVANSQNTDESCLAGHRKSCQADLRVLALPHAPRGQRGLKHFCGVAIWAVVCSCVDQFKQSDRLLALGKTNCLFHGSCSDNQHPCPMYSPILCGVDAKMQKTGLSKSRNPGWQARGLREPRTVGPYSCGRLDHCRVQSETRDDSME